MASKKEASLNIERLSKEKDSQLRIFSAKEIQFLLQDMQKKRTRIALYFDGGDSFIMTRFLFINDDGAWLDIGPHQEENRRILLDPDLTIVSLHQQVKVQFEAQGVETALFDDKEAFFMPLPESLLRIQRRENFRLTIPIGAPIACTIPTKAGKPGQTAALRTFNILDISCGGVALSCEENDADLQKGAVFKNCKISLPNIGDITVSIEIRNSFEYSTPGGKAVTRMGCLFINPDYQTVLMLQNYINRQQLESMVRE